MGSRREDPQWRSSPRPDRDRSKERHNRAIDERKPSPLKDRHTEHRRDEPRKSSRRHQRSSSHRSRSENRDRGRRRRKRSNGDECSDDQRRKRRRRCRSPSPDRRGRSYSPKRKLSPTPDRRHRRRGDRNDSPASRPRRRRSSAAEERRHSRKRKRRTRLQPAEDSGSSHSSRPLRLAADVPPRAGVVSVGSEEGGSLVGARKHVSLPAKKKASGSSSRDDTVGHFQGREGALIADRYRILREVGVGTFGRVVECLDLKRSRSSRRDREENVVAIKVVRNVKRYFESALIEAEIVEDVNRRGGRGVSHCALLHDAFSFAGHYCMVFESLGPSLYDFLKRQKYQPFPLVCVRDFAKQLLETLEFLHSFRLIHTDLKPENVLLLNSREVSYKGYTIPECTRIKVIDFGGATYDNEKKSSVVNTRQYRAPEVILGVGWSMPSDMWSVGCILAELYQGELLFATHDNVEHLALIEQVVGPFPTRMLERSKNVQLTNEAFDSSGAHRMEKVLPPESLAYVKRIGRLESLVYEEDTWFLRLLRRILVTDPEKRATAHECLRNL